MRKTISLLSLVFILNIVSAQTANSLKKEVYKFNLKIDIPVTGIAFVTSYLGFKALRHKPDLDSADIVQIKPSDINRIDREAVRQDYESSDRTDLISDYGMNITLMLPFFLIIDEEIRKDWSKLLLLYLQTQAINGNVDSWGFAKFVDRNRPLVYNSDFPMNERLKGGNSSSFYSGHVATTATASFFMAKVYNDYHPELAAKKYLVYSAAIVPPTFVGIYRYKASQHYPTDVIAGLAAGALFGILVPHLHKPGNKGLTILPISGEVNGLSIFYDF